MEPFKEQDDYYPTLDSILPRDEDAEQQASLLSTISEMFSSLKEFDVLSSALHTESRYQAIPPSISILPSIKFNTISDVLKKIYDERIFELEGEQDYWQMVANEKVIDDSFMTGLTVSDIDFDGNSGDGASASSDCAPEETTDATRGQDVWNGKILILGHAQLHLLNTPLLLHLALLFGIPDSHGKSRRQLEKTLLDYYQSKLNSQNIECVDSEMTFDMPRQIKKRSANGETNSEKSQNVATEWRLEEDQFLRESVPRLFSEHQELTQRVTTWIKSFLTNNPTWIADAPRTYTDTTGTQVWKVICEELKRTFINEDWFKSNLRGEKHIKQRWNVLERGRLQGWLEQMVKKADGSASAALK